MFFLGDYKCALNYIYLKAIYMYTCINQNLIVLTLFLKQNMLCKIILLCSVEEEKIGLNQWLFIIASLHKNLTYFFVNSVQNCIIGYALCFLHDKDLIFAYCVYNLFLENNSTGRRQQNTSRLMLHFAQYNSINLHHLGCYWAMYNHLQCSLKHTRNWIWFSRL